MTEGVFFPQGIVGEAAHIHNEGMRVWREGRLDEALTYFLRALTLKEQAGNLSAAASSIHMIGVVYAQKEDWENATRYLLRSLDIDAEDRHLQGVAKSLNDIAVMCGERGQAEARLSLVELGNLLLAHDRGEIRLNDTTASRLCDELPEVLNVGVLTALTRLMGW